ncbi:MAG TPA: hypothetical protein VF363_08540 [Candidatus Eisenbacteria bacterium]
MAMTAEALSEKRPLATGNDRDFLHLWLLLNPFRYVRTTSKAEFIDKLEWILRWSVALCFIGHGFWGAVSKPEWVGLITPMGFSERAAWFLLPYIGWADIALGVLMIARPRSILLWKAFLWASFTPFLRPLAGMSWFEVPERAGNFGIPLAFIVLASGMGATKSWWRGFELSQEPEWRLSDETIRRVRLVLQLSIGLLLMGHGGLVAITQKHLFVKHFAALGITATPGFLVAFGAFEVALGAILALRPSVPLVWFVFFWKVATEILHPIAGRPIDFFETVERWGDYGGCIALLLVLHFTNSARSRVPDNASP